MSQQRKPRHKPGFFGHFDSVNPRKESAPAPRPQFLCVHPPLPPWARPRAPPPSRGRPRRPPWPPPPLAPPYWGCLVFFPPGAAKQPPTTLTQKTPKNTNLLFYLFSTWVNDLPWSFSPPPAAPPWRPHHPCRHIQFSFIQMSHHQTEKKKTRAKAFTVYL